MKLPQVLYDRIKVHALEQSPRECCGIVPLRGDEAVCTYRVDNVAENPTDSYRVDERQLLGIMEALVAMDIADYAVYHSHPTGPAYPSARDLRLAQPASLHLILGLGSGLSLQAWRINNGGALSEVLEIA